MTLSYPPGFNPHPVAAIAAAPVSGMPLWVWVILVVVSLLVTLRVLWWLVQPLVWLVRWLTKKK